MEWADLDDKKCPCKGTGWAKRRNAWKQCPVHFSGQLHPESRDLLLDDPKRLKEFERRSHLEWRVSMAHTELKELQLREDKLKNQIQKLEAELINKTRTVEMEAVRIQDLLQNYNQDGKPPIV